jgi:uncharacterized membrane protein YfhO
MSTFLISLKQNFIKQSNRFFAAIKDSNSLLNYGIFLTIIAILFFGFALFSNSFTIPLSGDYVMQQIPFYFNGYDDWWHFFRTGEFVMWDSSTYLGSNNIGSNSFYYFLNPFFLPILIFPRFLVPQGLAILMIAKMVMAGFVFRYYLKYMGVTEKTARLFGLIYAFSGWMTYYLWFNHFMEVAVVFPLILLGIEKLLKEKRPWFLAFALFLMGITNYFFLVSSAMAGVLYALFRYFQTFPKQSWSHRLNITWLGILAFAVGIIMSSAVVLPSMVVALQSNRVSDAFYLNNLMAFIENRQWKEAFDYMVVWYDRSGNETTYDKLYPLISFFFPTVSNRSATLLNTSSYDNTISSLFIYTPMILFFIPSIINSIRQKKISHFVPVAFFLFALFTPIFYYLFHGFTLDYGRWQIFAVNALLVYIALNYDQRHTFKRWFFDVGFVFTILMAAFTFYAVTTYQYPPNTYGRFNLLQERAYVGFGQLAYIIIVYLFLRAQGRRQVLTNYLIWLIAAEAVVMGTLTMNFHGLVNYNTRYDNGIQLVNDQQNIVSKIQEEDPGFYRIYNLNAGQSSNINMRLGYDGLTSFHSLYNYNVMEFNRWSRINYHHNGWSMGVHEKRYNLDAFLNVKYYMLRNIYDTHSWETVDGQRYYTHQNVPLGFERVDEYTTDLNTVYINNNFIPGGFSFDNIIKTNDITDTIQSDFFVTTSITDGVRTIRNEEAYLQGAILNNEDASEVSENHSHFLVGSIPTRSAQSENSIVRLITCEQPFNATNVGDLSGCIVYPIVTSQISNTFFPEGYEANQSAIYIEPTAKPYFGEVDKGYFYALDLRLSFYATVYLFNQDDEIIVRDAHSFVNSDWKTMRGYYSSEPVKRIVIVPKSVSSLRRPTLLSEPYQKYLDRLDALKQYPLENVKHTANTITFSTNYEQSRFIVLSTPYDPGWSVKITSQDNTVSSPKIYSAQGGFIGFISGVGESEYEVKYLTPYFQEGLLISLSGFIIFGGTIAGAHFVSVKRRRKEDEQTEKLIKPTD